MRPNYSGRFLDKIIVIVAKQTAEIRENPDDAGYPAARGVVVETTAWAIFEARERLQQRRLERVPKHT